MDASTYAGKLADSLGGAGLVFPMAEHEARLAAVHAAMAGNELDLLLISHHCDLNWLTGYDGFGVGNHAVLALPREGAPLLHSTTMEIPAAVMNTWIEDIVLGSWAHPGGMGGELAKLLKTRGLDRGRIGLQPRRAGLRADTYQALLGGLDGADPVDASDLVGRLRLVKSPAEIDCLRRAAAITEAGVAASFAAIGPGATDNDIVRAGFDAMLAAGSDFLAIQPIATTGVRTGGGHQTHRRVPLVEGDLVFLEYGGNFKRYTAPLMRMASFGAPPDGADKVVEACLATLQAVLDGVRPGRSCDDVAREARAAHRAVDDESYIAGVYGYHVGVGYPPTWADSIGFIAEGVEDELRPGMTFHLPLAFRLPGRFGIGISETILVTEDGCEALTSYPRELRRIAV
ncbi:MAG: aminopeptidase P family protein [Rhodospirillaceae bacterium]|jgi:Xaa-Pro dipeptidase|nr:aminopeptidase P family protein [Rhodospirillaceae bacterium]MBT6118642.1 aminopeptidase P family protein [Rhodospirillaceae bacterium]